MSIGGEHATKRLVLDAALQRAAAGDVAAFAEFYDLTFDQVIGFFYRRVVCAHTAADLCSETYARALAGARQFDAARGTATAWLFGIASHLFADWLRRGRVDDATRKKLGIQRVALDDHTIEDIETRVDLGTLRDAARDAVGLLSPLLRDALLLRVGLDLPYAEVARRLEITEVAARVRVSRAIARIHDTLDEDPDAAVATP